MSKKLIVIVCRGNIARSPVAEQLINRKLQKDNLLDKYEVTSRGIQGTKVDPIPVRFPNIYYYKDIYKDAKPVLDELNIDLSKHVSKPIDGNIAEQASVIFAMDDQIEKSLFALFSNQRHKIKLFSELLGNKKELTDPATISGESNQRKIFEEINQIVENGFDNIIYTLKKA